MTTKASRRWPKIQFGILVAALGVFYLGGGLVFANKLRTDALIPQPPSHDFGVWVTDLDDETITLFAPANRQDINHPGTIGVYWEGGYGQVGEILASSGTSVTRSFISLSGNGPPVCSSSEVADCDPVDLEGWAFASNPSDVGLEFSNTTFGAPIGDLGAWVVGAGDSATWAIHVHGWRAARRETVRMLPSYHRAGITSLVIDYRNDPGAPPDPSGHYRFGLSEWEDVDAAMTYALQRGAQRIILSAYSTGAAAVLAFAERSDQMDQVKAIILDSPNINMGRAVYHAAASMNLPLVPVRVPRSLTALAMGIADLRWDVRWDEINYVERADQLSVPILVFHGLADDTVPIVVSRGLAAVNPEHVTLIEVPEAAHVMSWNADPEAYERKLEEFLDSI